MSACNCLLALFDGLQGANAQFDFFLGEGSSVITATNVYRNRKACTDIEAASKLVERTSRSSRFLGPQGTTRQIYEAADVVWRGQLFPRTLHLLNYRWARFEVTAFIFTVCL